MQRSSSPRVHMLPRNVSNVMSKYWPSYLAQKHYSSLAARYILLLFLPPFLFFFIHLFTEVSVQFSSFQALSGVWFFVTPWTAACQASLTTTNSRSLLKLISIESVMPSNHLILCCPFLLPFPPSGSFPTSQFFASGVQSIGASASASVLLMNIQECIPLGLTGLISFQTKGLSRECLLIGDNYVPRTKSSDKT